jgi:hypothetical protein
LHFEIQCTTQSEVAANRLAGSFDWKSSFLRHFRNYAMLLVLLASFL